MALSTEDWLHEMEAMRKNSFEAIRSCGSNANQEDGLQISRHSRDVADSHVVGIEC